MHNSPVLWSEGMFLRPHHFQAADRFWGELVSTANRFDHPCGYGIARLTVNIESLQNNVLDLVGLSARMKDGTLLESESTQVDSIDLNTRLASDTSAKSVQVFLAIPQDAEGQGNTATSPTAVKRYLSFVRELPDEIKGDNRQEVPSRRLNYRIMLSTEDCNGFYLLPLLKLLPVSGSAGKYRVDPDYFPPMLEVASWQELKGLVGDLRSFILGRIKTIGEVMKHRGISLGSSVEGDAQKLWLMNSMNQAAAELECIALAPGVHPLVAYTCLCSIVGRLSIFGPEMTFQGVPPYDHDNLAPIFREVCERIRALINNVRDDEVIQRPFVGSGRGMSVSLQPEWLGPEWEWYFGVKPHNFQIEYVPAVLHEKQGLVYKLGSAELVESYFTQKQEGLIHKKVRDVPRALQGRGNWAFFQIKTDTDAWKRVATDFSIAMRIKEEQIANLRELKGNTKLIASLNGQSYSMEFAVFAFKKRLTA
ncbi:MAG: type VI secretion system baseplate subunit TssK [Planctomycetota bacterium]|jgi:type VI secretion system protein ImpJ